MNHSVLLSVVDPGMIKLVIFIVAFIVWLVQKAMGAVKKPPPAQRRSGGQRAGTPATTKPQPAADPKVHQEIEQFLQRAAQRRTAKAGGTQTSKPVVDKSGRRVATSLPTLELATSNPTGAGVAEHVKKHLATDEFNVRAAHLADDVARSEQEMQDHLQKAFSHQIGRLTDTSRSAAQEKQAAVAAAAAKGEVALPPVDFVALFADGNRLRQAVIVNEILQRPEHRW